MSVLVRRPRIFKPRHPVLNARHPLARGLGGLWTFHEGAGDRSRALVGDDATNEYASDSPPWWENTKYGKALAFGDATDRSLSANIPDIADGPATLAALFRVETVPVSDNSGIIHTYHSGQSNNEYIGLTIVNNSSTIRFECRDENSNTVDVTSLDIDAGWHAVVGVRNPDTTLTLYVDDMAPRNDGPTNGALVLNRPLLFGRFLTFDNLEGNIAIAAMWTRALSSAEARQFIADPFALARPRSQAIWPVNVEFVAPAAEEEAETTYGTCSIESAGWV